MRFVMCLLAALILLGGLASNGFAAGYRAGEINGAEVGVWYPSPTPPLPYQLGDYQTRLAVNAQPVGGRHPLLVYSHGMHGDFKSQHITAAALADAGFVVVAIQHQVDDHIGSGNTIPAMVQRVEELQAAVAWVEADSIVGNHINSNQIHGLGYSLGGATVTLAAGARLDVVGASTHCNRHAKVDKQFCDTVGGWFGRLIGRILPLSLFIGDPHPVSTPVFINGRLVLVSPVGQGLDVDETIQAKSVSVLVVENDEVLDPFLHGYPLAEKITNFVLPVVSILLEGSHESFNAPLTANDAAGLTFIANANAYIIDALTVPTMVTEDSQPSQE